MQILFAIDCHDGTSAAFASVVNVLLAGAHLTTDEHTNLLRRAGFVEVVIDTRAIVRMCETAKASLGDPRDRVDAMIGL